jgi:iron complex transport system ATP-binding protein
MLRIGHLDVSYGDRTVIRDLDLEVAAGEFVALVGPNGCGKTTLLKAISRVVPWAGGNVAVGEVGLDGQTVRTIARLIAVVPQGPLLPAGYTAGEVVIMGRTAHLGFLEQEGPDDVRIARESLAMVGALHLADRPVDELSGGEKQIVVLARALAQRTPVLLLDEPTANLDIGHQIEIALLVRDLAAAGKAVLAAIHDLTLASLYADRLALMSEGKIVAAGPPAAVLTEPAIEQVYGSKVEIFARGSSRPVVLPKRPAVDQRTSE